MKVRNLQTRLWFFICLNFLYSCTWNSYIIDKIQSSSALSIPETLSVSEGQKVTVSVSLGLPSSSTKILKYRLEPLSAAPAVNYSNISGTVVISAGSQGASLDIDTFDSGMFGNTSKNFKIIWTDSDDKAVGTTIVELTPINSVRKIANLDPVSAPTFEYIDMGTYTIFSKWTAGEGTEVWRTDGTPGGTFILKDICSGACSSEPTSFVKVGTTAFFVATPALGQKLQIYKSDGTVIGTVKAFDISQITNSVNPNDEGLAKIYGYPSFLVASSNRVFFFTYNQIDGNSSAILTYRFYSTQGDLANTYLMGSDDDQPYDFLVFNDRIFITGEDQVFIWTGAGSGVGITILQTNGNNCRGQPNLARKVGSYLFLACFEIGSFTYKMVRFSSDFSNINYTPTWSTGSAMASTNKIGPYYFFVDAINRTIRRTDGTLVGDIVLYTAPPSLPPKILGEISTSVIFNDGTSLYQTDGTVIGTSLITTLTRAPTAGFGATGSYFYFSDLTNVLRTDLTGPGTSTLLSIDGEPLSNAVMLSNDGTNLFFKAFTLSRGTELWKVDSMGNVSLISETKAGLASSHPGQVMSILGGSYFTATNSTGAGVYQATSSPALASLSAIDNYSKGTPTQIFSLKTSENEIYWTQNTEKFSSVLMRYSESSNVSEVFPIETLNTNRRTIIGIDSGKALIEGYFPFGAPGNTGLSIDLLTGIGTTLTGAGAYPHNFGLVKIGNGLLYSGTNTSFYLNREPHFMDLSTGTTTLLSEIVAGNPGSNPFLVGKIGGFAYFIAGSSGSRALYKTDGTAVGTTLVVAINSSTEEGALEYNGKYIFAATTAALGKELWITDGTAMGTSVIKDIRSGASGSLQNSWGGVIFNGSIYFSATDGISGLELWKSDGTSVGTVQVQDLCSGACSTNLTMLNVIGNKIYFFVLADNPTPSNSTASILYQSDGTALGTSMVVDLRPLGVGGVTKFSNLAVIFLVTDSSQPALGTSLYRFRPDKNPLPELISDFSCVDTIIWGKWKNNVIVSGKNQLGENNIYLVR